MPTVSIPISAIHSVSNQRKPGYLDAVHAAGKVDGQSIILTESDYDRIASEFALDESAEQASVTSSHGAGDLLAGVLTPLAGVLDAMLGTNLKNCPGCKRRRAKLNRLMPLTPKE